MQAPPVEPRGSGSQTNVFVWLLWLHCYLDEDIGLYGICLQSPFDEERKLLVLCPMLIRALPLCGIEFSTEEVDRKLRNGTPMRRNSFYGQSDSLTEKNAWGWRLCSMVWNTIVQKTKRKKKKSKNVDDQVVPPKMFGHRFKMTNNPEKTLSAPFKKRLHRSYLRFYRATRPFEKTTEPPGRYFSYYRAPTRFIKNKKSRKLWLQLTDFLSNR